MPGPTLQDAIDANKHIRNLITKKSDNKFREEWSPDRKAKYKDASQLLSDWAMAMNVPDPEKEPIKHIEAVAKFAGEKQAGNCMQYACAAFVFLRTKGVFPIEVAGLWASMLVGHTFLIVGRPAKAPLTIVGLEKSEWAESVFIVDGWTNIACAVKTYRQEWKQKLAKWADKKKGGLHPFTNQVMVFDKASGWPNMFDSDSELVVTGRQEK